MKINELIKQGFKKFRKPFWNEQAYLELDLLPNGSMGPWATLHDPPGQAALGHPGPPTEPQKILSFQAGLDERDWEGVK